ncbi:LCP family protein [Kibdelosporangium philippinense]|uniref:LCP family protein n=1 Tax=Kibdelosporangium philippinense TaxID=211113 RepID=A0ABS8ZU86_9PSEU|nr:LCP family protein [Kibdelosporangium philippinense]MCE7010783.1 LCP family protein [Kibdelosporangium philippinense]
MTNDELLIRQAIAAEAEQAVDPGTVLTALRQGAKPRRKRIWIVAVAGGAVAAGIAAVVIPLTASRAAAPPATSETVNPPVVVAETTVLLMGLDVINIPDTIVLAKLGADGSIRAVSLPRDSHTASGYRLNSYYAKAGGGDNGAKAMVAEAEKLTGIRAEHYVTITQAGFVNAVSAIGGVEVCLKTAAKDRYSNADFRAGKQILNGDQAMAFIRQRHGLPQGDLDRITRHQAFLRGLAAKLTGIDAEQKAALATALLREVKADPSFDVLDFAKRLSGQTSFSVATVPVGPTTTGPAGDTLTVNPEQARRFTAERLSGQPSDGPECVN